MTKGVLVDLTKCIGCNSCVVACKMYNNNKWIDDRTLYPAPTSGEGAKLADENWTVVRKCRISKATGERIDREAPIRTDGSEIWRYVKEQCLHCKEPACVSSCFATAFVQTELGPITYYPNLCVGCRYCMLACPFSIPKFEWDHPLPMLTKCSMCSARVENGDAPACVAVCPTDVMKYGEYDDLLQEAKAILARNREYLRQIYSEEEIDTLFARNYVQHIYGEEEAGGTLWIYISDTPFEELGFKMNVPTKAIPAYTKGYTLKGLITGVVWGGILTCLYFVIGAASRHAAVKAEKTQTAHGQSGDEEGKA